MQRKVKVILLFHLIFAFSYLFWLGSKPILKEVFLQREEEYLFTSVVGKNDFFHHLPLDQQEKIEREYEEITYREGFLYFSALIHVLFKETSIFGLAWVTASVAIPLCLFFRVKRARKTSFLLPILVLFYTFSLSPKASLREGERFPIEKELLSTYLDKPIHFAFRDKKKQLLRAWHCYLVKEYAKELPKEDEDAFKEQVERGLFAFNIARIENLLEKQGKDDTVETLFGPPSLFSCFLFLVWNSLVALVINRGKDENLGLQQH